MTLALSWAITQIVISPHFESVRMIVTINVGLSSFARRNISITLINITTNVLLPLAKVPPLRPLPFQFQPALFKLMIVLLAASKFFVSVAIWVVNSTIVLDNRLTASRSDRVAVAKLANTSVQPCCISENSLAVGFASSTLAAYPPVWDVSDEFWTSSNARAKWVLKVAQSFVPVVLWSQSLHLSIVLIFHPNIWV